MSLDGRTSLANGESKWITSAAARADVQHWRARSSAILTGSGTVLADDPRLTVRLPMKRPLASFSPPPAGRGVRGRPCAPWQLFTLVLFSPGRGWIAPPLRVVLDRQLRTPGGSHVLDGSTPTLVLHGATASCADGRFARVERAVVATPGDMIDLRAALELLAGRGCNEVQVEAGPTLCGALFAAGLVDELLLYVAPLLLGDSARALLHLPTIADMAQRWRLQVLDQRQIGVDWRLRLRSV